ncbi:hypothetical protein [Mycolicibacterium sp. YH-1]|uniref:hypothetical protein n=1 Tax=Mycolicibacterium sp. YH-1 TaxID=2908837 RepID=UPI001F4BD3A5|nr:hypothetical protein [Mycolicibacterium sp. YH-1]UNB52957.1 hypothetical protein L0M16_00770 [Mycolicibacterium sp. YH-1]
MTISAIGQDNSGHRESALLTAEQAIASGVQMNCTGTPQPFGEHDLCDDRVAPGRMIDPVTEVTLESPLPYLHPRGPALVSDAELADDTAPTIPCTRALLH